MIPEGGFTIGYQRVTMGTWNMRDADEREAHHDHHDAGPVPCQ
jgi:hypothetical protein